MASHQPQAAGGDPAWARWRPGAQATPSPTAVPYQWSDSTGPGAPAWGATSSWDASPQAPAAPSPQQTAAAPASSSQALVVRETALATVPEPAAAVPKVQLTKWSTWGEYVVVWQVWTDYGWTDYDREFADTLEKYWQEQPPGPVEFSHQPKNTVTFDYNVVEMWQMSRETKKKRTMRRLLMLDDDFLKEAKRKQQHDAHNAVAHTLEACHERMGKKRRARSLSISDKVHTHKSRY